MTDQHNGPLLLTEPAATTDESMGMAWWNELVFSVNKLVNNDLASMRV